MTTREKYKQAFSVLKSSDDITLEELMMKKEKQRMKKLKNIRIAAACFVFLFVCTNGIAYAATEAPGYPRFFILPPETGLKLK